MPRCHARLGTDILIRFCKLDLFCHIWELDAGGGGLSAFPKSPSDDSMEGGACWRCALPPSEGVPCLAGALS